MIDEVKGVSVYNPAKQISIEITLKLIMKYRESMELARSGTPESLKDTPISSNDIVNYRLKGLKDALACQQGMISDISRPIIKKNCIQKWERKYKSEEERIANPFEEEDNDYNEIMSVSALLSECEKQIRIAKQTKTLKDDFIWEKINQEDGEKVLELTENFFNMFKELEEFFETIWMILLEHEIVANKNHEDEEMTYKEQESLFLERFTEA